VTTVRSTPVGVSPRDDAPTPTEEGRDSDGRFQVVRNQRWWAGRAAVLPVHVAIFALAVFFLVRAIPGDPVLIVTGGQITPEIYDRVEHALGLDGSILDQLGNFYSSLLHFDLGTSMLSGRSVGEELATRFPATLELALMGLFAVIVVSLVGAFLAVMRPTWLPSRVIRGYARTAGAIPEFCVGIALIVVFYSQLRWVPAPVGRIDPYLSQPPALTGMPFLDSVLQGRWEVASSMSAHLILPILVMVIAQSAVLLRLLISGLDEAMDAPATRFRIASGASRRMVLLSMLRRALPPAVTMLGIIFGYLLGGAVILESLFGFTGMGQYMVEGVNSKDLPVMQGFLIVTAVISLTVFFLVDLANMVLDPRRRPGVRAEGS
jgi:ABC-type dipeptide/oligopeptide/nickel transport system permease component